MADYYTDNEDSTQKNTLAERKSHVTDMDEPILLFYKKMLKIE